MISLLHGELVVRQAASVVIDVGGVGFEVLMSAREISQMPEPGMPVKVLTKLVVRDDSFVLYGFTSVESRDVFEKLTSVSGVGPKVALAVLSAYSASEVVNHVVAQDASAIQRVPGVGKKMASRVILELKDRFGAHSQSEETLFSPHSSEALEASREALLSMGFTQAEIELALKGCPEDASESALLQYALRRLGA